MSLNIHKTIFKDIKFWILLLFAIRLIGITNPPLEVSHNWRQTTVCMPARNFLEVDNNIFFPRVDFAGEHTGITGMEFPALNYLIYLFSLLAGYDHWYGRLINLIISTVGVYYFYKCIKLKFSEELSFWSTLLLNTSIWYIYSRKIMPDTFASSLAIIGVYWALKACYKQKTSHIEFGLFGLFATVSILAKLPVFILFSPLLLLLFDSKIDRKKKVILFLTGSISIIPPVIWYFHWVPYLVNEYRFWHFFMGKTFSEGFIEISENLLLTFQNFYQHALGISGFIIFLLGIYILFKTKEKLLTSLLLISSLFFLILILKSGWTFAHHSYYMIPFVPYMCLVGGYGMKSLSISLKVTSLLLILTETLFYAAPHYNIKNNYAAIERLETELNKHIPPQSKIVINSDKNPTPMYFSHHKGWICDNQMLTNPVFIQNIINNNGQYLVILKRVFGKNINLNYPIITENENFKLYKLPIKENL